MKVVLRCKNEKYPSGHSTRELSDKSFKELEDSNIDPLGDDKLMPTCRVQENSIDFSIWNQYEMGHRLTNSSSYIGRSQNYNIGS